MTLTRILVALDGSADAAAGGALALALARAHGAQVLACHACDVAIHATRFREMEPGLPAAYQGHEALQHLREAHAPLMGEGFQALAQGYLESYLAEARRCGIAGGGRVVEGRNYIALLGLLRELHADLAVLGAQGLGAVGDGRLGSTAARLLRAAPADVLIARPGDAEGPVLAGVDGSEEALAALEQAAAMARALGRPLQIAAAYDPDLHKAVFTAMARALSPERQAQVGLSKQEALHKTFIDDGLATLYRGFLEQAVAHAASLGANATAALLRGKAYRALVDHARAIGAAALVVGRFGHHRGAADIGSNAEAVAHLAPCSVLVAAPAAGQAPAPVQEAMAWDADALARLDKIPAFARPMARQGIEQHVRARGGQRVTLQDVRDVGSRMGMSRQDGPANA